MVVVNRKQCVGGRYQHTRINITIIITKYIDLKNVKLDRRLINKFHVYLYLQIELDAVSVN